MFAKDQSLNPDLQGDSPPPMNAPTKLKYSTDDFALCVPGYYPTTDLFSNSFFPGFVFWDEQNMGVGSLLQHVKQNQHIITVLQGSFAGSDGKFTLRFS